ncbi:MAG: hypothetical protein WC916_06870 [Candidatus Woesearchaeota archaeon]
MAKDYDYYARKLGNHPKIHAVLQDIGVNKVNIDFLRRLTLILPEQEYRRKLFFDVIAPGTLAEFISHPPITNATFEIINELDLLPISTILTEKRSGLEKSLADIRAGGFDRQNPLHLELEYSKYKIYGPPDPKNSKDKKPDKTKMSHDFTFNYLTFSQFSQLPWINGEVIIGESAYTTVKRHAIEAVAVYNHVIENRRDMPTLVIGNDRYGLNFVVDPITEQLTAQGIKILNNRVSSRAFDRKNEKLGYVVSDIWKWVSTNNPDIFIIDGTVACEISKDGKIHTRFPAAMWGYLNDFTIYNVLASGQNIDESLSDEAKEYAEKLKKYNPAHPYAFNFWAPHISEKFFIGDFEYDPSHFESITGKMDYDRKLHIINSVSNGDNSSRGYFDDHDNKAGEHTLGFNSTGLQYTPIAPSEESFLKKIQDIMKEYIKKDLTK